MPISISRSIPNIKEKTGDATIEFSVGGAVIEVNSKTGYQQERDTNGVVITLEGIVYKDAEKDEVLGEYESFERENKLRENRPGWLTWITRTLNAERPTSFEQFFEEFVVELGDRVGMSIDPVETGDAFDRLAQKLIDQNAFSKEKGEGNWKPYSRIWKDRRWLDEVQGKN